MLSTDTPTHYPAVFLPRRVERILSGTPTEPALALIQLPSPPQRPENPAVPVFNQSPPKRLNYGLLIGVSAALVIIMGAIASVDLLAGALLFGLSAVGTGVAFWQQWRNYPKRLEQYREKERSHQNQLTGYNEEVARAERDYQLRHEQYRRRCQDIEQQNEKTQEEHRRQCDLLRTPEGIQKWRQEQIKTITLSPAGLGFEVDVNEFEPRGYAEYERNCRLPSLLRRYFGDKIHVLYYVCGKIPDFSYIDPENSVSIDIEIDEPYIPRQYPNSSKSLEVTHCIGQSNYDERTQTFQSNDWYVFFFSERQALRHSKSCCKALAQLIDEITGSNLVQTKFQGVPDLEPERCWTEEEAREMAERRARLNY
jgi:hypothetical protein